MHYSEWPEERKEKSRISSRKWNANNKGKRQIYYKEYEDNRTNENRLWRASRNRATKFVIPHNISQSDINIPRICPICKKEMRKSNILGGTAISPTVDRVFSELGYVKGNIAVICKLCNSTKGSGSAELHRKIADYMDTFN